jgi:hypothetical protein
MAATLVEAGAAKKARARQSTVVPQVVSLNVPARYRLTCRREGTFEIEGGRTKGLGREVAILVDTQVIAVH